MGFTREALTFDDFLGGRLGLWQPRDGYRAGIDPMLLAAAVQAEPGESVLELGCGAGAAILALGARIPGLRLVGVEKQADYADLAWMNARENDIELDVHTADLASLPDEVKADCFDHVILNPPYHLRLSGTPAPDAGREVALGEDTPLADWLAVAGRRVKPRGYLTLIQKAERLPDILAGLGAGMGSVLVKPVCPRRGRAASLVIVSARKAGRGAFRLAAPLILHQGDEHENDGDDYRPEVGAILREAAHLPLW